jgi:AAA+ superfamily predicted ATPase
MSAPIEEARAAAEAYATSGEQIADELRWLDLQLQALILDRRREPSVDPLAPFKGLVISDAEVARLLATHAGATSSDDGNTAVESRRLRQEADRLDAEIETRRVATIAAAGPQPTPHVSLLHLARQFRLTRFEERCVLICLAPELDLKYQTLYAYAQDDVTRLKPSVGLVLSLLRGGAEPPAIGTSAARAVFEPTASLRRYRLLRVGERAQAIDTAAGGPGGDAPPSDIATPWLSRPLTLDDRIVNHLLGLPRMDTRLAPVARLVPSPSQSAAGFAASPLTASEDLRLRARRLIHAQFDRATGAAQNLIIHFHGPAGAGKRTLAEAICHDLDLPLIVGDARKMVSGPMPVEEAIWLLGREAILTRAALCVTYVDVLLADPVKHEAALDAILETARALSRLTFVLGERAWSPRDLTNTLVFVPQAIARPTAGTSQPLWVRALTGPDGQALPEIAGDVDAGLLASRFPLGPSQIRDVMATAAGLARWRMTVSDRDMDARPTITSTDLTTACRTHASPRLGALARKIEPRYAWRDIVLPDDQLAQLRELCDQALLRDVVYGRWRFDARLSLGKGLSALFSGPPGTGKTMAAEVIAGALQLDLYQIDLSQVVSKYIGESEKNLHQIFTEAQASHAILFFDEADALFGKRSEVKDAHDRYANIEVGYLLQKMEEYEGIAILATNVRHHLDDAFVRRLQFIVEFPFPDEEFRRRIWEVIFPREAPLGDDVDLALLAREVKLAGGNIKNIALASAFLAARDGGPIGMPHLMAAARREHEKSGRTWNEHAAGTRAARTL